LSQKINFLESEEHVNTRLEDLFNLTPIKQLQSQAADSESESTQHDAESASDQEMFDALAKTVVDLDKIDAALPQVIGLEASEREMDQLADMATEGYKNLMELGMNVEARNAAEIFGAASSLLGHALTARKNKIEKKLKTIELQLKKQRLDLLAQQNSSPEVATIQGSATVIDRNALIAQILNKNKPQD